MNENAIKIMNRKNLSSKKKVKARMERKRKEGNMYLVCLSLFLVVFSFVYSVYQSKKTMSAKKPETVSRAYLVEVKRRWHSHWEASLAHWSRFTRLQSPRWCISEEAEKAEGVSESFAMIRHHDHAIVISIRKIVEMGLEDFPEEIIAHEIGHHVFVPADFTDHGRMLARMKKGLPSYETQASFIANLYGDLLINDRLQRQCGLNEAGVYQQIAKYQGANTEESRLWTFYMRTFEILWSKPKNSLTAGKIDDQIEGDAILASRLVRVYGKYWMDGAGKYAALCLPYLMEESEKQNGGAKSKMRVWMDMEGAGKGGMPNNLSELDEGELAEVVHPALDPLLNGKLKIEEGTPPRDLQDIVGGQKKIDRYRGPMEYGELLKELGVNMSSEEKTMRYYRERAMPYLIPFPVIQTDQAKEKSPEGFARWEIGSPLEKVDWFQSIIRNPLVIPGLTTVERLHGTVEGRERDKVPVDLYIGIDCSGSMPNPAYSVSYPTLAATIMGLSAIRANAKIMACLSGEPGQSIATDGFIREEKDVLKLLTNYLGTGYAFGIRRLESVFNSRKKEDRPVHILVITDQDIFSMLDEKENGIIGWEVARQAREKALAGATFVLNMPYGWRDSDVSKLHDIGWNVYRLYDWEELVTFARDFSHKLYAETEKLRMAR
jgi:hypothetical protein